MVAIAIMQANSAIFQEKPEMLILIWNLSNITSFTFTASHFVSSTTKLSISWEQDPWFLFSLFKSTSKEPCLEKVYCRYGWLTDWQTWLTAYILSRKEQAMIYRVKIQKLFKKYKLLRLKEYLRILEKWCYSGKELGWQQ